jgi:hypothetical protein
MPPQGQGPTEARPLAMTASVRAPQRWQRISATAGISILPLILMFPSRALTPALGNLAAERVELPGANACKLTRFRSGEGPKWPLRPGKGGLRRHGGSRDREGRGGGRPGALLVRRLRLSADAPAHRRTVASLQSCARPEGVSWRACRSGSFFGPSSVAWRPTPRSSTAQPANRRRWASARTWTPTAATGSCGPAAGPTGRPGMRAPNIAWGAGLRAQALRPDRLASARPGNG